MDRTSFTECGSVGCDMPGHFVRPCSECSAMVMRCESCRGRFAEITRCTDCTGGSGRSRQPVNSHSRPDQERDEDANGCLANARRALEEA